jgi:hypothetical protein
MLGRNRGKKLSAGKRGRRVGKDRPSSDPAEMSHFDALDILNADEALVSTSAFSAAASQLAPTLTIPRKFGWDLAPIHFPDAVEAGTVDVFLKCKMFLVLFLLCKGLIEHHPVSFIAKELLFPLEPCVFFERKAETWIVPLTLDPAFLHTMIFVSQYYFDALATGRTSAFTKKTLHHFLRSLKLLRERISSENQTSLSDTTTAAVMALTGHALVTGDLKSAANHIEGLHKIVSLRGGVATFQSQAKLLIEILR